MKSYPIVRQRQYQNHEHAVPSHVKEARELREAMLIDASDYVEHARNLRDKLKGKRILKSK